MTNGILLLGTIFSSFGFLNAMMNPWYHAVRVAEVDASQINALPDYQAITQSLIQQDDEREPRLPTNATIKFFPFLGEADPSYPAIKTPKYNIYVQMNGLNVNRSHWIDDWTKKNGKEKKAYTPKYLKGLGRPDLVAPFQDFARKMQDKKGLNPAQGFIPTEIDKAYEIMKNKYLACGGGYANVARNFKIENMTIEVIPAPFLEPTLGSYVGGVTYFDGKKNRIKIVDIYANGIITDPKTATLRYFNDWARWEIGNALSNIAEKTGVKTDKREIGDASPCGK